MENQQQFKKSANGGYLNPSQYGEDQWFGTLTITPELVAQINDGKVAINVSEVKQNREGKSYRRITAKAYTPKQVTSQSDVPREVVYGQPAQATPPGYVPPTTPSGI